MICAIQQPTFLPWIGYFAMIESVDLFVFLDNVQLVKRSWWVRNKIKTDNKILYLTVPIKKTESRNNTIANKALIDYDQSFIDKHIKSIKCAYGNARFYDEVFPFIQKCFEVKHKYISDFNISIIKKICKKINISTPFIQSSQLKKISGKKDNLLVSICKEVGADNYLSAEGSMDYIESKNPGGAFYNNDIKLFYRRYSHPQYIQLFGNFVSHLCVIDLLFNIGFEESKNVIMEGKKTPLYYKDLYKDRR